MTNPVSVPPVDVAAIRARVDAATIGPWVAIHWPQHHPDDPEWEVESHALEFDDPRGIAGHGAEQGEADAEFIAHARTDVPALLDALVSAESRAQEAENAVSRVEALHVPYDIWAYDDTNGTWVLDPDGEKILMQRVCTECSADDAVEEAEDCNWFDGDSRLIDWPCATVAALRGDES